MAPRAAFPDPGGSLVDCTVVRRATDSLLEAGFTSSPDAVVVVVDEAERTGWSVLLVGVGYEVTDALDATSAATREFPVDTWALGRKSHWIRIERQRVTGRRLRPGR